MIAQRLQIRDTLYNVSNAVEIDPLHFVCEKIRADLDDDLFLRAKKVFQAVHNGYIIMTIAVLLQARSRHTALRLIRRAAPRRHPLSASPTHLKGAWDLSSTLLFHS